MSKTKSTKTTKSSSSVSDSWKEFMEISPVPAILLDKKGMVVKSNILFRKRVADYTKNDDKGGWSLLNVLGKGSKDRLLSALKKYKSDDYLSQKPINIRFEGEDDRNISLYINHLESEKDVFLAYFVDITEQKSLEHKFIQAQKMQAVGQLAGGISHDFNNLLTAMIGFCDLLLARHSPGDQSFADIMQIKQNANRAANLVRQLLAFSRKQTLQPKIVDITDTLAELSNLIGRLIGENIELEMVHGRNIGAVKVDQGQFEQVIINLAVNARDAINENNENSDSAGGKVAIKTSNVGLGSSDDIESKFIPAMPDDKIDGGEYILVEVIDTGKGMDEKTIHQIFEPFFTTKALGEGTGLGLSTASGIVQQTGGYMYVASKVGKGTEFRIYLKYCEDEESSFDDDDDTLDTKPKDLTGTGTILIVEDEDPVRLFSSRALTNKGYKVLEAENGEEGLEVFAEKGDEIDVIISDVVMPGVTGPEMVKEILKTRPDIKVIFISGYGEDVFVKTFGSSRDFNFLPKPYSLEQLALKVKEVMEKAA